MWTRLALSCAGSAALLVVIGCSTETPIQPAEVVVPGGATPSTAATPGSRPPFVFPEGCCYYNGVIVRTVVPPAATPKTGRDNFYSITNGVANQKGVVGVAPGDEGYHGGHWAFHAVTFTGMPFLLTSEAAVLAAEAAGAVTIERIPDNDFRCPIQE